MYDLNVEVCDDLIIVAQPSLVFFASCRGELTELSVLAHVAFDLVQL